MSSLLNALLYRKVEKINFKLVDFAPGGDVIARFFFVADPDGYQIEVLQRGGRYE